VIDYARALGLVYDTIDVVNRQLPAARRLRKAPDTVIAGAGGALDSLGFVNFVLALEEKVAAVAGAPVALLDEDMLVEQSPLRTVESVSRYIAARVA
jgi:acyl carrier protein